MATIIGLIIGLLAVLLLAFGSYIAGGVLAFVAVVVLYLDSEDIKQSRLPTSRDP